VFNIRSFRRKAALLAGIEVIALGATGTVATLAASTITEFRGLAANGQPNGIAAGPDGNLWFTEQNGGVVDLPVSFEVHNVNRSKVPCLSDGAGYAVRGHLVAPEAALAPRRGSGRAVTLYLHGSTNGEQIDWRSTVPGYNYALELAKAGHVSVTIDRLGFDASGLPNGLLVCFGSQADVIHQVVTALRSGHYTIAGRAAPTFQRVALAGISFGGAEAAVEAYSFKDIDALIELSSAIDQGFSPAFAEGLVTNPNGPIRVCPRGGDPKYPDGHGPGGYTYIIKDRTDLVFYNADPQVVGLFVRSWEREPCGEGASLAATLVAARLFLGDITVPVLLAFGKQDALLTAQAGERQKALYTGSKDVTLVQVDNTGHAMQLERTAPASRAAISDWLHARGFSSQPASTATPAAQGQQGTAGASVNGLANTGRAGAPAVAAWTALLALVAIRVRRSRRRRR
jgi:pimeloyl-ACP methyl ester carboxylesterase